MTADKSIARRALDRIRWTVSRAKYRRGPLWMSRLRRLWVQFSNPQATIVFQGPVYLGPGFSIHAPSGGQFVVGPGVEDSSHPTKPAAAGGPRPGMRAG